MGSPAAVDETRRIHVKLGGVVREIFKLRRHPAWRRMLNCWGHRPSQSCVLYRTGGYSALRSRTPAANFFGATIRAQGGDSCAKPSH